MEEYITIPGSPALTEFRRRFLAKKLGAKAVYARYMHYIALRPSNESEQGVADKLHSILEELLTYGEENENEETSYDEDCTSLFVTPRSGTISPWSSKATNIAVNCGLLQVRRIERGIVFDFVGLSRESQAWAAETVHDRMTEMVNQSTPNMELMFAAGSPAPLKFLDVGGGHSIERARLALQEVNKELALSLDETEIEWLGNMYQERGPSARPMTDVELMTFASYNSDHCRHKVFNAAFTIDGQSKPQSLFEMIRNTHQRNSRNVRSAYSDNAAVMEGPEESGSFLASSSTGVWTEKKEKVHYLVKVETHNAPTAVSPFPGSATGAGGEIRDEGSVGRGSTPRAGLVGFCVSELAIPEAEQPWDMKIGNARHTASGLDIMLEAPIGSATYNNEFGRPCLCGYFRSYLMRTPHRDLYLGYHKPIMIVGGHGVIGRYYKKFPELVDAEDLLIILGGPALRVGLNGASASSTTCSEASTELDFASVQRGNAEMQRRAQEVINSCVALGNKNPIKFIHDVGAGGLGKYSDSSCLPKDRSQ